MYNKGLMRGRIYRYISRFPIERNFCKDIESCKIDYRYGAIVRISDDSDLEISINCNALRCLSNGYCSEEVFTLDIKYRDSACF